MLDNKNAQIGETVTWVVATVIIIIILIFSTYIASILASASGTRNFDFKKTTDLVAFESFQAYLRTDVGGQMRYLKLQGAQDLDQQDCDAEKDIFEKVYKERYNYVFLMMGSFFGCRDSNGSLNVNLFSGPDIVSESIKLGQNKEVEITFGW